jgi:zinc transport system substrate-binding protein
MIQAVLQVRRAGGLRALVRRAGAVVCLLIAAFVAALAAGCSGCSDEPKPGSGGGKTAAGAGVGEAAKSDGKLDIVCTTVPIYSIALAVVGDAANLSLLPPPETGPHGYQPTLKDRERLFRANIVVINGLGHEEWFDAGLRDALKQKGVEVVDCGGELPEANLIPLGHHYEHGDHDHSGHGHAGQYDPHIWLSFRNIRFMANSIESRVAKLTTVPDRSVEVGNRRDAYLSDLYSGGPDSVRWDHIRTHPWESYMPPDLGPEQPGYVGVLKSLDKSRLKLITSHDAFAYFARDMNISVAAVLSPAPGQEATLKNIETIRELLSEGAARVIFVEPQFDATAAKQLAAETGARVLTLDPGETCNGLPSHDFLPALLRRNAAVLADAFAGKK